MANSTSTILRDLLEQSTGLLGESMKKVRLRREEQQRAEAEAQEIKTKTADLLIVKSSLAITYKNFQSIEKDLKILARAIAADIALNTEENTVSKKTEIKSDKQLLKNLQQQNKKDDAEDGSTLSGLMDILDGRVRGRGRSKTGRSRPKTPTKIPRGAREGRIPSKTPISPQEIERRARTASRNAYNRAIASGLTPEEARIRSQLAYDESRRRGATGAPRNLDLGETPRARSAEITDRENKLRAAETDAQKRYAEMRARAQAQAGDIERQRKQIAADRANVERLRAQVLNDQRAVESSKAQLTQDKIALERQRAQMVQAETASRANIEAQRTAVQTDYDQRLKALEVQKERLTTIQNDYNKSWAQRHVQLEAQQRVAAERITSSASVGSAAVAEARRVEAAAATAVAEHKAEWDRVSKESTTLQADLDKEIKTFKAEQATRAARVPPASVTPSLAPTPVPGTPTPTPAPQRVAHVPLNSNARAAIEVVVKNKIVRKISQTVATKLPLIGLAIVGGIATWQLIQGKTAQAAITVAEGFDPTIVGVTAVTFLPTLKMETYYEKYGVAYNYLGEDELADARFKEISDIVDEQWRIAVQEMKDSWRKSGDSIKESWRRDLDKGIGTTLRESISGQPTGRGRGRNVLPAATPVQKPGASVLLPKDASVTDAIKQAALLTGVSESILLAMAKQESSFNPNAKASTSSAKGLFQFLDSTWNDMVKKYGKDYPQLLNGPFDPLASAIAGALYIKENQKILEKSGIPVTGSNIYATHFLGPYGAVKLLSANPSSSAADILPQAASANRSVFFNADGTPKTVGQVEEFLYGKVGQQAEQYAALLQQPSTGLALAAASTSVAAQSVISHQRSVVVIERENTRYVSTATNGMSSRRENIPLVT